jgi:hypothetical protein
MGTFLFFPLQHNLDQYNLSWHTDQWNHAKDFLKSNFEQKKKVNGKNYLWGNKQSRTNCTSWYASIVDFTSHQKSCYIGKYRRMSMYRGRCIPGHQSLVQHTRPARLCSYIPFLSIQVDKRTVVRSCRTARAGRMVSDARHWKKWDTI